MPERALSPEIARTGLHLVGWLLTFWAVINAVITLTDPLVVNIARQFELPPASILVLPATIATLQLWGHVGQQRRILAVADLLGGLMCMTTAAIFGYAVLHCGTTATAANDWLFIGLLFLVHTVMLQKRRS